MSDKELNAFLEQVRSGLDRSVSDLDFDTLSRLDAMRREALNPQRVFEKSTDPDDDLLIAARVSLDDSVDNLEPAIIERLTQARRAALMTRQEYFAQERISAASGKIAERPHWLSRFFDFPRLALPAGALATACLVVTVAFLVDLGPVAPEPEFAEADVLLFASNDDIELYENLEFYLWLAENGLPN